MPQLSDITLLNEKETRAGFGEGILEAGRRNPNVVYYTQVSGDGDQSLLQQVLISFPG